MIAACLGIVLEGGPQLPRQPVQHALEQLHLADIGDGRPAEGG